MRRCVSGQSEKTKREGPGERSSRGDPLRLGDHGEGRRRNGGRLREEPSGSVHLETPLRRSAFSRSQRALSPRQLPGPAGPTQSRLGAGRPGRQIPQRTRSRGVQPAHGFVTGGTVPYMERDAALEAVFMPVQPASTFEETVERLGSAIRLGLLAPGDKLPPERELAQRLRISRSTLRQALTALVQSGHLVSSRGRTGGTFVAERPPLAESAGEPLDQGAWAVLDYRVAIESGAAVLAAERGEEAQFDRLGELVTKMAGELDDFE